MPTVPDYGAPRSSIEQGGNNTFRQPQGPNPGEIAGRAAMASGDAMVGLGGKVGQIANEMAEQANQVRVTDAVNQLTKARTELQIQAVSLQGRAALERPDGKSLMDEYGEKLAEVAKGINEGLGNKAQQQAFMGHAGQVGNAFLGTLGNHMIQQQKQFEVETDAAKVDQAAKQGGLLWAFPNIIDESKASIEAVLAKTIQRNGWDATKDAALIADARDKMMTPLHQGVIRGMIAGGKPEMAKAYFEANSAGMTLQSKVQLADMIQVGAAAEKAQRIGAQIADQFDYLHTKDAQKAIDAMDIPASEKVAIRNEVEHRHAVAQSDADKSNAVYVGRLDEMVQRGMSQAAIEKTPEFMAVRDKGTVLKLIRERTEHAVNLQAAIESRDYTRVQRLRAEQTYNTMGRMFAYQDPQVLAGMTRPQVAALQLELGAENTGKLLERWDMFAKSKDKLTEAKIDNDLFNSVADTLGLKPYAAHTEDEKRALGNARNNAEIAISLRQQKTGKELTREEKSSIMAQMAASEVKTKGLIWGTNPSNLLVAPSKDVDTIAVPDIERGKIIDKARRETGDPKFMPTEAQIGAAYKAKMIQGVANGR